MTNCNDGTYTCEATRGQTCSTGTNRITCNGVAENVLLACSIDEDEAETCQLYDDCWREDRYCQ